MTLRKTGACEECGEPVYGDEYGAVGHACVPQKVTGFLPSLECPLCHKMHKVTHTYKGNPLLSCPKMEMGKIYFTKPLQNPLETEKEQHE